MQSHEMECEIGTYLRPPSSNLTRQQPRRQPGGDTSTHSISHAWPYTRSADRKPGGKFVGWQLLAIQTGPRHFGQKSLHKVAADSNQQPGRLSSQQGGSPSRRIPPSPEFQVQVGLYWRCKNTLTSVNLIVSGNCIAMHWKNLLKKQKECFLFEMVSAPDKVKLLKPQKNDNGSSWRYI